MPRKVLVVDDNDVNRQILRKILSNDYQVLEAANGEIALELLRQEYAGISAVLLDLLMPVMDGYDLLVLMHADRNLAQIPVIVATGTTESEAEVKALSLGANDYILKPYNPAVILHRLQNTISLREGAALVNAATRDRLTGLYNREAFFDRAAALIAEQSPGYYVLASFDVDGFKVINDQYGTAMGDEVLRQIAKRFQSGFEPMGGLCCRMMADHFAVLYPASFLDSRRLAQIRAAAAEGKGLLRPVAFSIGRYLVDDVTLSVSAMYDRAMLARDSIKGRYDVHIAQYDESMRDRLLREQEIVYDMSEALRKHQFEVWFQPQYNHSSGALIGAEALVRWRHPEKGMISPGVFIPVFERNGFIYDLDQFVWEQTCLLLRRWLDEGRSPLPVSVNVSRYDVFRPDLIDVLTGLIRKYNLPFDLLRLEITESAFAESGEQIIRVVKRMIECGFTVEIDDFGSGYSSLNTLKDVPATVLKLDMRFLEGEGNSERGGNIVESIVRMARWLGMSVIAEGVETKQQADYLVSIGCNYIQGYFYARPMPVEQYEIRARNVGKEERMLSMESVDSLDNDSFWNPASMDTLIFNSYVGGACIFEYHEGKCELLRFNPKYAEEIGAKGRDGGQILEMDLSRLMDEENLARLYRNIEQAVTTDRESACEVCLSYPGQEPVYVRTTVRVIARAGDRVLLYCAVLNVTAQRAAEQRERDALVQLRAIMDNVNSGVSVMTRAEDGTISYLYANDQFYRQTGYTREQFAAEVASPLELVCPEDRDKIREMSNRAYLDRMPYSVEYRICRRDGGVRWIQGNTSVAVFDQIHLTAQIDVTSDVTEQRHAELQIQETAAQLLFLNEAARELITTTDMERSNNSALRKTLEYYGCDRAFVVEFDDVKQVASNTYEICAEGVPSEQEKLQNVPIDSQRYWFGELKDDRALLVANVNEMDDAHAREREMLCRHGIHTLLAVPLWLDQRMIGFLGLSNPTRHQDQLSLLRSIGDMVSAAIGHRNMRRRMRNDSRDLTSLMDGLPGGFARLVVQPDGSMRLGYVNDGFFELLGYTKDEVMTLGEKGVMAGVHRDDIETARDALQRVAAGEHINTRYRLKNKAGGYTRVQVLGRRSENEDGEPRVNLYYAALPDAQ